MNDTKKFEEAVNGTNKVYTRKVCKTCGDQVQFIGNDEWMCTNKECESRI